MTAIINGEPHSISDGSTVADLLQRFALPDKSALVERNGEPVERETFALQHLEDGDRIEIVSMVAGG